MKKTIALILAIACLLCVLAGCEYEVSGSQQNITDTKSVTDELTISQPTPTDINYSLERYNLIRRAYWVNGQREKAAAVICEVEKPLGYIVLFAGNAVVGRFVVDGKVTSLNSYLSPDSEYYEMGGTSTKDKDGRITYKNSWLADVDGSYGENDFGIFFFTPDGKYVEWTGEYLYSDIPFEVDDPVVKVGG